LTCYPGKENVLVLSHPFLSHRQSPLPLLEASSSHPFLHTALPTDLPAKERAGITILRSPRPPVCPPGEYLLSLLRFRIDLRSLACGSRQNLEENLRLQQSEIHCARAGSRPLHTRLLPGPMLMCRICSSTLLRPLLPALRSPRRC
jgi:hypothetical protein